MNQAENILDLLTSAIVLSDSHMTVHLMNQTAHALFERGKTNQQKSWAGDATHFREKYGN